MLRNVGMLLAYVVIILITNYYGADGYGRYSIAFILLQLMVLFFSLGLPQAIVKLTADFNFFRHDKPLNNYLRNSIILLIISSIIGSLLLFISKDWLASFVFDNSFLTNYFSSISIFLIFAIFHVFVCEFIRAKQMFGHYGLFMYLLPNLFLIIFLIIFHQMGLGEQYSITAQLIALCIITLFCLFFFFPIKSIKRTKKHPFKSLLTLSFPMMFSEAFLFITNWVDVIMLGIMASKEEVGLYNAAFKLAILSLIIIRAVNTILGPRISKLYSLKKMNALKKEVQKATKIVTILTLPIVIGLIIFREEFLSLFGPEFIKAQTVLIIISVSMMFSALSGTVGQILNMTNYQKELRNLTLISALINIALNYMLIPLYGINGAAIASLISTAFLNIACVFIIKNKLGFYIIEK